MKNDPLFQDFINKNRIRTSAEQNLTKHQRKIAYRIYNFYDWILFIISGIIIIATIIYTYCASQNIIHQPVDVEILIILGAFAIVLIVLPVTEFIIFKHVINRISRTNEH